MTRAHRALVRSPAPLAEVKAKVSEMIDRVEHTHDRTTITCDGRLAAVLIGPTTSPP